MSTQEIELSLTGHNSHKISIPLGQGSLSIGTIGMDTKKFDVLVEENLPINWDTFSSDRPRFFYYYGNDQGFIKWTEKRKTEDFTWVPQEDVSVDFTNSHIRNLSIHSNDKHVQIKLGKNTLRLYLSGTIQYIDIQKIERNTSLIICPTVSGYENYTLPLLKNLKDITNLAISMSPVGQALDCESLVQFKALKSLSLQGSLTNLHFLEKLEKLEKLALRYVPDLENLPALHTWKNLTSFIGWNIEETKGKVLRSELKKITKERTLEHASVSQLKKAIWFTTEYGIPFSAWPDKEAKKAVKVYKATLKMLKKSKTEKEVKSLLTDFTKVFNDFAQIETTEREDIGEAIHQLRQVPAIDIDEELASKWFDEARDY
ncbi:hypothetical protein GCM10022393_36920 [Aquimarina addita]|uniref:Uncharacterized protein n=1 Tax=Aquimarina addita TaxID=870485 RepID=A0ABP6UU76_9FLAO